MSVSRLSLPCIGASLRGNLPHGTNTASMRFHGRPIVSPGISPLPSTPLKITARVIGDERHAQYYDETKSLTKVKADWEKALYIWRLQGREDPVAFSRREKRDIRILIRFVHIFCLEKHRGDSKKPFSPPFEEVTSLVGREVQLCESCSQILAYGIRKRFRCPHNPKPMCKKCET